MSIAVMAASGPGCKEGETVACCHTQVWQLCCDGPKHVFQCPQLVVINVRISCTVMYKAFCITPAPAEFAAVQTGPSEVGNGQDSFQSAGFSPLQGPGGVLDSRVLLQSAHVEQPGTLPFFNPQLTMNEREKITESLLTGVKVSCR